MATADSGDERVAMWWVLLFIVLTIGLAAIGVIAVGGQLIVPPAG